MLRLDFDLRGHPNYDLWFKKATLANMLTIACYFWVTNIFDDFPIFRICYFDVSKNAKVKSGRLTSNDL